MTSLEDKPTAPTLNIFVLVRERGALWILLHGVRRTLPDIAKRWFIIADISDARVHFMRCHLGSLVWPQ